jgi:hypothetical protein
MPKGLTVLLLLTALVVSRQRKYGSSFAIVGERRGLDGVSGLGYKLCGWMGL